MERAGGGDKVSAEYLRAALGSFAGGVLDGGRGATRAEVVFNLCVGEYFSAAAGNAGPTGPASTVWWSTGSPHRVCSIPTPNFASPPAIHDKSRMR